MKARLQTPTDTRKPAPERRRNQRRRSQGVEPTEGAGRRGGRGSADSPPRNRRSPRAQAGAPARERRPTRSGPQTTTIARPTRAKSTSQAKARAKARKAKAPKVIRPPLGERLIMRLASIDLRPRTLAAKVPFVVLVIGSLGLGLGLTLWLSTDAAERSYQLGKARETTRVLTLQKEALEREVLEAQSAPALAEAGRGLGMIPSKDTAHLVPDPGGNWVLMGTPKPAEGVPPPPLNTKLPEEKPPPPVNTVEVPVHLPPPAAAAVPAGPPLLTPAPGPEVPRITGAVDVPGPSIPGPAPAVAALPPQPMETASVPGTVAAPSIPGPPA